MIFRLKSVLATCDVIRDGCHRMLDGKLSILLTSLFVCSFISVSIATAFVTHRTCAFATDRDLGSMQISLKPSAYP